MLAGRVQVCLVRTGSPRSRGHVPPGAISCGRAGMTFAIQKVGKQPCLAMPSRRRQYEESRTMFSEKQPATQEVHYGSRPRSHNHPGDGSAGCCCVLWFMSTFGDSRKRNTV